MWTCTYLQKFQMVRGIKCLLSKKSAVYSTEVYTFEEQLPAAVLGIRGLNNSLHGFAFAVFAFHLSLWGCFLSISL